MRFALAVPFYKSGLTKWDGFLQLSGGAEFLFGSEFKLHIFGSQYPYPFPMAAAYGAGIAEIVLPILLVARAVHALCRARPAVHDRDHPDHRAGGLGELSPALGGDGADAGGVRRRADRAGRVVEGREVSGRHFNEVRPCAGRRADCRQSGRGRWR